VSLTLGLLMQISVSVQIPDTIAARAAVPLVLRATASGNTAPRLTVPLVTGATVRLLSDVTRLGGGFGQAVATRETRYMVRAIAAGTLVLSPVVATLGREQAISPAKTIVVLPPPTNAVPALVMRAPISRGTTVNFHALVTPETVWAGEQITLQVGVFIDDELRSRLQRNPEYVAPSVDGAVAYDLPVANDVLPNREVGGATYRPFIFARALFPLRAGPLVIPQARLAYTLGAAGTMFGQQERQTVSTPARSVVVRELPTAGRPASFGGAVGVYDMRARVDGGVGRVGDAVQLTVDVIGVGNVKLLPAPAISIPDVTVSPAGESISVDSSDLLVRGRKTFRFLLTPRRDGLIALGVVQYAFFNPVRGTYEQRAAALGSLRVAPGTTIAADEAERAVAALPLQGWRVDGSGDVTEQLWFQALLVALGLPWVALVGRRLWFSVPRAPSRERRSMERSAVQQVPTDAAGLRRSFADGLRPMAALRPDEPFAGHDIVQRLRRAGATTDAAEAAGALLERLDRLTFGQAGTTETTAFAALANEAVAVTTQLRTEMSSPALQRIKSAARAITLLAGAMQALQAQPADFVRGQGLYAQQRFSEAAVAFAAAAVTRPSSAVTWANLGAAHWMRADTAGAIVAWQRSARLAPRLTASRALLAEHAPPVGLGASVVPVSTNEAWLALLLITVVVSLAGATWRWRHKAIGNAPLLLSLVMIGAGAMLVLLAERSHGGARYAVIRRDVALRTDPVLAGEARSRARAGEIATRDSVTDRWSHLTLDGGRSGWVEGDAVRSLALDDARDVARAEARVASPSPLP